MRRSIRLRKEPSIRQTRAILAQVDRELTARGAVVERDTGGALRFRMPHPWRAPRPSLLAAVNAGRVLITAAGGGPWRLSYELDFRWLTALTMLASVVLVVAGWGWPRLALLNALAVLWLLVFGVLYAAGIAAFHRLLTAAAREIVERRHGARLAGDGSAPARTPRDDTRPQSPASATPDVPDSGPSSPGSSDPGPRGPA